MSAQHILNEVIKLDYAKRMRDNLCSLEYELFEEDERLFYELVCWNNCIKEIRNYLCNISPDHRLLYGLHNFEPDSIYCVF